MLDFIRHNTAAWIMICVFGSPALYLVSTFLWRRSRKRREILDEHTWFRVPPGIFKDVPFEVNGYGWQRDIHDGEVWRSESDLLRKTFIKLRKEALRGKNNGVT